MFTMTIPLVAILLCRNIFTCLSERTILHSFLCRIGSPNGKAMSPAGGRDARTGQFGNEVFGTDNFLALPLTSPNGFMFGGTPYAMAWLIIRMIGRSRERRSFCDGKRLPGRRVCPSAEADIFRRRRRAIELSRGMQRPSDRVVDRAGCVGTNCDRGKLSASICGSFWFSDLYSRKFVSIRRSFPSLSLR
jgi:hypothetical protein